MFFIFFFQIPQLYSYSFRITDLPLKSKSKNNALILSVVMSSGCSFTEWQIIWEKKTTKYYSN